MSRVLKWRWWVSILIILILMIPLHLVLFIITLVVIGFKALGEALVILGEWWYDCVEATTGRTKSIAKELSNWWRNS